MPSISRRALLTGTGAILTSLSGCAALGSSPTQSKEESDPHWVKMYLGDRDETHNVAITITNEGGDVLFEKEYHLSDSNEADEDATFPASTDPEMIVVTVDGTRFERDWPGFEQPKLPCDGANEAGIKIYVEDAQDGTPNIRLEADCQSIRESNEDRDSGDDSAADRLEFTLRSPALGASSDDTGQATMDRMFTQEGANVSPPLIFEDVPRTPRRL